MEETMQSVRAHMRGGPEVLMVERAPRPVAAPGEALVQVEAAAITPTELSWNETYVDASGRPRTPTIPSHEVAGRVIAMVQTFIGGHDTSSWRVRLGDALVTLLGDARPREVEPRLPTDDLAIEDCGASLTMQVLRAAMIDADDGALATFREVLDAGRAVDANTLAKLGFALLYDLGAPRAAIAVFSACAARFPSLEAQANLGEAQLVLGDRLERSKPSRAATRSS